MSVEDWCIHHASRPGLVIKPVCPRTEFDGAAHFGYLLTHTRELLPHAGVLASIGSGTPRPRVIKVAIRRTFAEVDRLAKRWGST